MQKETISTSQAPTNEQRLPWHRPAIERLLVSLDTRNAQGSGTDAENYTSPSPSP